LRLLELSGGNVLEWPVPFSEGLNQLDTHKGKNVVVLVSGDPFWYGAGAAILRKFPLDDIEVLPGPSTFGWAAARMGWSIESISCVGLHAKPVEYIRSLIASKRKIIALMRDGDQVSALADYLTKIGFGKTKIHVLEALGGENEKIREVVAEKYNLRDVLHPVCAAILVDGLGSAVPLSNGIEDNFFANDGQITKSPIRALTLAALAPKYGQHLWDLGAGSGSVSIEWVLSDKSLGATAVERDPSRCAIIEKNVKDLGLDNLSILVGSNLELISALRPPNAVFIGGGLTKELMKKLWMIIPEKTRLVANSVTLETEMILQNAFNEFGGNLVRIEISTARAIGSKNLWQPAYPITQWSVEK
jgi:precorrin-6Y C5,15-methyltransferase (decarboxylating)